MTEQKNKTRWNCYLVVTIMFLVPFALICYIAYTPYEYTQLAHSVSDSSLRGTWKIEKRSREISFRSKPMKGWREMRLHLYYTHRFKLELMPERYQKRYLHPSPTVIDKSLIIEGEWGVSRHEYSSPNGMNSYMYLWLNGDSHNILADIILLDTKNGIKLNWFSPDPGEVIVVGDKWVRLTGDEK